MKAWLTSLLAAAFLAAASASAQEAAAPAPRTLTTSEAAARPQRTVTPEAAPATTSAEQISLAADTSKGFARILFRWPRAVTFDASIADGVLIVRFARPFRLPADRTSLPLDKYVSIIKQDPDQRTLRLSLKQKLRLSTSAGGPVVAIDLLPASYAGTPEPIADPTAKPPAKPKGEVQVKLAVGVERDRTRLAFDWFENVGYEAAITPGKISVTFARQAKIDVKRLNDNPPAWVRGARVSAGDNATLLDIDVDPGSPVKHFRNSTRIVFDVGVPASDGDDDIAIVLPEGIAPEEPAKPAPGHGEAKERDEKKTPPADTHAEAGGHAVEGAKGHDNDKGDGHDAKPAEHAADPEPHKPEPEKHATEPETHEAESQADAPPFGVVRERDGLALTLPALGSDGAAMFKRGDTVFIVIDGVHDIDTTSLTKKHRDLVASAASTRMDGATLLTIGLVKPLVLTAALRDYAWTATLAAESMDPPRPIALLRDAQEPGTSAMRATLQRGTRVLRVTDPASGENILVVLASGDPQGVIGGRRFVEFAAEPTAQGLALLAYADDLIVTPEQESVLITAPGGLTLSAGPVTDYAPGRAGIGAAQAPAAMDFASWTGSGQFLDERSRLVNAIAGDDAAVEEARLDIARFYLAHDLGAEAFGELQLVAAEDQGIIGDPTFRALRGTALLQLQRYQAASDELGTSALDDDLNARLFRGLAAAGLNQWVKARDAIAGGQEAIGAYRADWQARFRVAGARAAVETNAVDIAERMLAAIPKEGVPLPVALEADLVRGQLAQKFKRDDDALRLYRRVKSAGYRPLAVRATLAEIVLQEQTGELKRPDAIAALEALRWQWRGDEVELGVLHRLGALQIADGQYRNGLQTMRSAVLGFPRAEEGRQISSEMVTVFEDLFLRGKADAMPPIQALGLYYEFKELTPIGPSGDEMVRKLADRLIAVDLLEQAAELLQHQVDKRLDGIARAQIAARLAAVYLMDRKPEKALAALRASAQTRLPDDLAMRRRLLMGRALSDLKQYDAALEAFEQDDTPEADRLRADIHWAGSRWPETAAALEVILTGREKIARKLDAVERTDVLRAAVAYTMASDEKGLDGLRNRFITLMAEAPEAAAFEMVTRAVDPSGVAFRDMAKSIAATDTLDAFLQSLGLGRPVEGSAAAQ
jgi:tetratricopeptide (TPR) repeat protein